MIPVDQTTFGRPNGNCLQAALASLLELSLDEVPHVAMHEDWWERLSQWALGRGFELLCLTLGAGPPPRGYYLASGPAARGLRHVCVYHAGELAHDPHPDRTGLLRVEDYFFVMPLDPSAIARITIDN